MSYTHKVLRAFNGEGKRFLRGDKLDARGWLNVKNLEDAEFIERLTREVPLTEIDPEDNRKIDKLLESKQNPKEEPKKEVEEVNDEE